MPQLPASYRHATIEDATVLSELVNIAGEGLPYYLWSQLAEQGQSPWEIGRQRASREAGSFSYRNVIVREEAGQVTSVLIGYSIERAATAEEHDELPAMFTPLQQLEDLVVGSWYINVLASYPDYQNNGYGAALLSIAEACCQSCGLNSTSVIVANANTGAKHLYERLGYRELARRPMVKESWESPATEWILLVKDIH